MTSGWSVAANQRSQPLTDDGVIFRHKNAEIVHIRTSPALACQTAL